MRWSPLLLMAVAPVAVADVVFNNTASPLNTYYPLVPAGQAAGPEIGNQIVLAGQARHITRLHVRMRIGQSGVATFYGRVRLYANDGPGGFPGTLLWEGPERPCVIDSGADLEYPFDVPGGVSVPTAITWTVQLSARSGQNQSALGPAHYGAPAVGAASPGWWRRDAGGGWVRGPAADPAFGLRVIACYPNCDGSTVAPTLNVADFTCFLQRYAAGDSFANCDGSTAAPVLNVADFTCFLQSYAAGCP
jgi:hypothetical protein